MPRGGKVAFKLLAGLGVLLGLVGIGVDIYGAVTSTTIEVPHTVYWGAILFGFVGFFGLNPDSAERGANIATNTVTRVLNALPVPRFGRRSTDAVAVPKVETTVTAEPIASDDDKDETVERPKFSPGGA